MLGIRQPKRQTRIEEALDRAVTAAFAGPARQTSHGHPTQLAQRGGLYTLASTSENDHNIGHRRLLLA
jgi:hypothetical protein